jgi:predicted extracellular nuclease
VESVFAEDPNALVMVTGDLNDFQFSEPGEGPDHPVAIVAGVGGGTPLFNLINREKPAETFSFIFDGNSQVLDHMLVSPSLLNLTVGFDILHFNAGYPAVLAEDATTPLVASDHDVLEGRFWIR